MSTPSPTRSGTMRAWILNRYGPPDGLQFQEVPFPAFRDENEVLVRVYASSVNPADRHMLHPPFFLRKGRGFTHPNQERVGIDLAGRVEAVGSGVKGFQVGDEVFGAGRGAFGEYAISDQVEIAPKPSRLTFEQAATLPIAAVTALQALRDKGAVQPGKKVLINGASGGVGTFAVQIAKALGAEVDCVCSTQNVDLARSLGGTRVFDYSREDFAKSGLRWDVIFDTQLNHSLRAYRRVLNPNGILLVVGAGPGSVGRLLPKLLKAMLLTRIAGPKAPFFIAKVRNPELLALKELVDAGKLTPVIDRRYPMDQVPAALNYLIEGHARGKIAVAGFGSFPAGTA
jgi:NADPH:quinone reductase-like Zn-dependent oxidoreductase